MPLMTWLSILLAILETCKNGPFQHLAWYFTHEAALDKAALSNISDRRAVSCIKFKGKVRPGNPLYPLTHNRVVPISTSVCLRSGSSSRPGAETLLKFC